MNEFAIVLILIVAYMDFKLNFWLPFSKVVIGRVIFMDFLRDFLQLQNLFSIKKYCRGK